MVLSRRRGRRVSSSSSASVAAPDPRRWADLAAGQTIRVTMSTDLPSTPATDEEMLALGYSVAANDVDLPDSQGGEGRLTELAVAAAAGDDAAWRQLWEQVEPRLLGLMRWPRVLGRLSAAATRRRPSGTAGWLGLGDRMSESCRKSATRTVEID